MRRKGWWGAWREASGYRWCGGEVWPCCSWTLRPWWTGTTWVWPSSLWSPAPGVLHPSWTWRRTVIVLVRIIRFLIINQWRGLLPACNTKLMWQLCSHQLENLMNISNVFQINANTFSSTWVVFLGVFYNFDLLIWKVINWKFIITSVIVVVLPFPC